MLLRPLLAVASLTAAANAFLLPPELSTHDVEAIEALEFIPVEANMAHGQTVSLECAGCPPISKKHHGKPKHHKQHNSHLDLQFTIDNADEASRLMVNGFELYPNSDPFTNVLVAPQVSDEPKHHHKGHKKHEKHGKSKKHEDATQLKSHHKFRPQDLKPKSVEQQLGFGLQIHPTTKTADDGLDLVVVDLQIIEVGSVFVDGLANVRIHLIQTPDNKLMIAKIEQTASETTPMDDETQECTTFICKWRAIIAQQFEKMKMHGCAGMMGGKAGQPHAHHHHGHLPGHLSHNRPHGWALLIRKLTSHIVLPVLVGIAAGVSVSILGMIVGTILVGMWRKFVRGQTFFPHSHCRRLSRPSHHKASQNEVAFAEEKSALMASQEDAEELPPSYEQGEVEHVERV